jgi:alcohol oxidase
VCIQLGGTAGCVIASRLADADPGLSILVVEHGSNNDTPTVTYPALCFAHLRDPTASTVTIYKGSKSQHIADREPMVHVGRVLGGGSSVNMLTYVRAQWSDFDGWETAGWSAKEMLPYLQKVGGLQLFVFMSRR